MIKGIIFDCFGVIIGQGFDYTYRLAGGDPKKDRPFIKEVLQNANSGRISVQEFEKRIYNHLGISKANWQKAVVKSEQPNEALLNYIQKLRQKYKTAILSNAGVGTLDRSFGNFNLSDYFDDLIVSAEVGLIKPDLRIFNLAASRLNLEVNECLFIDDHETNIMAAKQAGMKAVLYSSADSLDEFKNNLSKYLS